MSQTDIFYSVVLNIFGYLKTNFWENSLNICVKKKEKRNFIYHKIV